MSKQKKPTKRQLAVLDALFAGRSTEQTVLKRYKVSRKRYEQWFTEEPFVQEFERRVDQAYRQSRTILARSAPRAANKLVKLTNSRTAETARKACLDVIKPPRRVHPASPSATISKPVPDLPPETAARLLAALAEEDR
jgi:hypothetical protein